MSDSFTINTSGHYHFVNITDEVQKIVTTSNVTDGLASIFVVGSTAAITTIEYEDGVINDIKKVFEDWAPEKADYEHHKRWGDANGAAHIKSAIIGTEQTVPIINGKLKLSTWQQLALIDFDEKSRQRELIVTCLSV
jgi:secondary thiamine-phosphate synthase enzyme